MEDCLPNIKMKLTIEIPCVSGFEMEKNLNRAIDDFTKALNYRGFSEMELTAYSESVELEPIYKLVLKKRKEYVTTNTII